MTTRITEGDRVVSLDPEDGGLEGDVTYVSHNGWAEVSWQDGGKSKPSTHNLGLVRRGPNSPIGNAELVALEIHGLGDRGEP